MISTSRTAGASIAIEVGAVVAAFYFIALVGIVRRRTWGAIIACVTAVFDTIIGFFLSATALHALAGAVLLAVVAVLAYIECRH